MSATVTVYNLGGGEVLGRVSLRHAIVMLHKGKARVLKAVEGAKFGEYDVPKAVELLRYVVAKWKYNRTGEVPFSKRGVFRRDNYTCAYCGIHGEHLKDKKGQSIWTADHILPKWEGHAASWTNSITACRPCNQKKGGHSPKEAGMKLLFAPKVPSFYDAYSWTHNDEE